MSFGSKACVVVGDYHVIDAGGDRYEVWYVNEFGDGDEFISEHSTLTSAKMSAQMCQDVDDVIVEKSHPDAY
jgi:hypothetical protein